MRAPFSGLEAKENNMADQQLWAIGNATSHGAQLTSAVSTDDNCSIPQNVITHTQGSGGNFIRIPDCSGSQWYSNHNITVSATDGTWTVSFWSNDQQNGLLYWSPSGHYYEGNPLTGSDANWNGTLLIQYINGNVSVGWAPF
jgi:hypothetical protein